MAIALSEGLAAQARRRRAEDDARTRFRVGEARAARPQPFASPFGFPDDPGPVVSPRGRTAGGSFGEPRGREPAREPVREPVRGRVAYEQRERAGGPADLGPIWRAVLRPFTQVQTASGIGFDTQAGPDAPTASEALVGRATGNLRNVDRVTGAPIRGALLNPSDPFGGAVEAIRRPEEAQLRNLGGIRSLPDEDIIGSLSPRDIVGGIADVAADVTVVGGLARGGGRALTRGATAYRDAANRIPGAGMSIKDVGDEAFRRVTKIEGVDEASIRQSLARRGVRGDDLENRVDLARELLENGAEIDVDGAVVLYHRTTPESAARIRATGRMSGQEDGVFFSTAPSGQADGFGDAVVRARVPIDRLELDDVFGTEAHVRIPTRRAGEQVSVELLDDAGGASPLARDPLDEALPVLRDALKAEVSLRRSGIARTEIAQGRATQAGRIASNLEAARAAGAGLDESLAAAARGAKVGGLRRTFNAPLELTSAHKDALAARLQDALEADGPFAQFNGLKALDNLIKGENVQPAQLRLLRKALGDEVADVAREANRGRPSPVAKLDAAARAEIDRAAQFEERQIAQLEQKALAQQKHADELAAQLGMDPTNARLKRTMEQALAKGLEQANRADALLVQRTQKLSGVPEDAPAALAQQRATFERVNALRAAEEAQRTGAPLADDQRLLLQAKELIGRKHSVAPQVETEMLRSLDYWLRGNRAILDGIGETTWTRMAGFAARASGNLADSYLTALFQRRTVLEGALTNTGVDETVARRAAGLMVDAELKARYPGGVPPRLAAEIEKTKAAAYGDPGGAILRGMAEYSQEWKNLAFGPADVGIFGQQVLKAASMSPANILAGTVNRVLSALNLPAVKTTLLDETALSKRLQYQLDGVPQGITTGTVQGFEAGKGTLLRKVPLLKAIDPALSRWIDISTDFQFRRVLGGLRNLNHEGNLVALHLLGQDITDPAVRATSAGMANSATSYAPRALRTSRANLEAAALMTPSMRRAQVTSILQLARVFSPKATAAERILGSIAILNLAGSTLAVAKLVHDEIGVGEFEMDPSKQGFGNITTRFKNSAGKQIVINLFPQQQVVTTITQATRALAEGDTETAWKEWAKLLVGSSGPALQLAEKAAGIGYQPGRGYRFGDYGVGASGTERALNLAPLPPIFQSFVNEGVTPWGDPLSFGLEAGGLPNYPESGAGIVDRAAQEAFGASFRDLDPWDQRALYTTLPAEQRADTDGYVRSVVRQQIAEAGFDAIEEQAWSRIAPEFGVDEDYRTWREQKRAELMAEFGAAPDARAKADKVLDKQGVVKAYRKQRKGIELEWILNNRDSGLAQQAADLGLLPTNDDVQGMLERGLRSRSTSPNPSATTPR